MDAITEFKRLVKLRTDPSFWEQNIVDSHELCKNEEETRLFYLFLCTPRDKFNPEMVKHMKTLGDAMDDPNFKSGIKELPAELTQDIYINGNETIIRTRRKTASELTDDDDEKVPVVQKFEKLSLQ